MIEKIKENWFVVLVATLLIAGVGYYTYDINKGKLPGKNTDGKDVVATIGDKNIFADDLYDELYGEKTSGKSIGTQILYMYFERAVVDAAVPTDVDLKSQVATQVTAVKQNYQSYYGDEWENYLLQGLLGSGYTSVDDLDAYFLHYLKLAKLTHEAYDGELETLFNPIYDEKSPRTVSHILVKMEDPENPTEEEQKKMDDVDAALKSGTDFAEVAKTYSDDSSAAAGGFLGYADSDTSFVESFKEKMLELKKDETSEWVQSEYGFHLIKVLETDKAALLADEEIRESVYAAIDAYYPKYASQVIWKTAQDLEIQFADTEYETAIKSYLEIDG